MSEIWDIINTKCKIGAVENARIKQLGDIKT